MSLKVQIILNVFGASLYARQKLYLKQLKDSQCNNVQYFQIFASARIAARILVCIEINTFNTKSGCNRHRRGYIKTANNNFTVTIDTMFI